MREEDCLRHYTIVHDGTKPLPKPEPGTPMAEAVAAWKADQAAKAPAPSPESEEEA